MQLTRTGAGCYLGMLTVSPAAQAGGMGRQLPQAAERWAIEHWQSEQMHMSVIVQRSELIVWYERRGYARTGSFKPFPYGEPRFGLPKRTDLQFEVLRKSLSPEPSPTTVQRRPDSPP